MAMDGVKEKARAARPEVSEPSANVLAMARRGGKGTKSAGSRAIPALELRQHLGQAEGPPPRGWLVLGEEAFLRAEALAALDEALLGPDGGLNRVELDGARVGPAEVLDELRARPFFGRAERRLVVVRNAGSSGQKGGLVGDQGEALAAWLAGSTGSSVLVVEAAKVNGRFKGTKALQEAATTIECAPPDESGLLGFVRARARHWGRPLAKGADVALVERLGGHDVSLTALDAEVQKLAAAGTEPATPQEVLALCAVGSSEESFGLVDCVGRGEVGASLEKLQAIFRDGLVANGERQRDPSGIAFMLLGLLRWDLGRLLRGRALLDKGVRPFQIASDLRVFRDKDRFADRLRRADRATLGRRHELLRAADAALKASADPRATLTDVVVRLARADQRRGRLEQPAAVTTGPVRQPRRW